METKSYWVCYLRRNGKIEAEEVDLPITMELSQSTIWDYLHRFDDCYSNKDAQLVLSWSEITSGVPYHVAESDQYISDEIIIPIYKQYTDEPVTPTNLISFKYGYMLAENIHRLENGKLHKYDLGDLYTGYSEEFSNPMVELGEQAFNENN